MISTRDSYFGPDEQFTSEHGLMIAFAITAYDSNREPIEDPSYGTIKAYYKTWGLEDSVQGVAFEEIPTTMCTRD